MTRLTHMIARFFQWKNIALLCMLCSAFLFSCQKELKLKYGIGEIKQVVIANLRPNEYLNVNISKSKQPNDFSAVEFPTDCKVDLYEDDVFKETMLFKLKDTLSGLGNYTSSFKLHEDKTYKIVSACPGLATIEATEYLPPIPRSATAIVLQHADSTHSPAPGKYMVVIQDRPLVNDYYFVSAYYRILKPTINEVGDTIYKYDYIFGIPSYSPDVPNPSDYSLSFFTDANFDGLSKNMIFDFKSQYNNIYKEIALIIEVTSLGKNYYDWNLQLIPKGTAYLNEGQEERINLVGNIKNGYGHFTGSSSMYIGIPIK